MGGVRALTSRWLVASTIGLVVGVPGGLALGAPLEVLVGAMVITPLMLGISGLFLGTSQWLAIRGFLPKPGRWVPLTTLGFAIGLTTSVVAVEQIGARLSDDPVRLGTAGFAELVLSVVVVGGLGGALLGLIQSLAFSDARRIWSRWTSASALGLGGGFLAGALIASSVGGVMSIPGVVVFLVASGLVYSLITLRTLASLRLST